MGKGGERQAWFVLEVSGLPKEGLGGAGDHGHALPLRMPVTQKCAEAARLGRKHVLGSIPGSS